MAILPLKLPSGATQAINKPLASGGFQPKKATTGSSGNTYSGTPKPATGSPGTQSSTVPLTTQVAQSLAGNHQQQPILSTAAQTSPLIGTIRQALPNNGVSQGLTGAVRDTVPNSNPNTYSSAAVAKDGRAMLNPQGIVDEILASGPLTSPYLPHPMGSGGQTNPGPQRLPDGVNGGPAGPGNPLPLPIDGPLTSPYLPHPIPGPGAAQPVAQPGGGGNYTPSSTPSSAPSSLDALAEILRNARTSGTRGYVDLLNNSAPTTFNRQAGMNAPVYDTSVPMRVAAPAAQQSRYVAPVPVATPSGSTGTPVQIAPTLYR